MFRAVFFCLAMECKQFLLLFNWLDFRPGLDAVDNFHHGFNCNSTAKSMFAEDSQ